MKKYRNTPNNGIPFPWEINSSPGEPPAEHSAEAAYERLNLRVERWEQQAGTRNRLARRIYGAAAILLLGLSCSLTYLLVRPHAAPAAEPSSVRYAALPREAQPVAAATVQEYFSPSGTRSRVVLPDSSEIWLNSDSRMTLAPGFGVSNRSVTLLGQAFFEIAHNPGLPFVVTARDIEITALGTSFTVLAYPDSRYIETVLVSGSTRVVTRNSSGRAVTTRMSPSQRLSLDTQSNRIALTGQVRTGDFTSWTHNQLIYSNTPIREVARSLERWFNVKVIIQGPQLDHHAYTGTFNSRSLEQILGYIKYTTPMTYTIQRDTVTITLL